MMKFVLISCVSNAKLWHLKSRGKQYSFNASKNLASQLNLKPAIMVSLTDLSFQ